ncbi:MAG: nucleotidyltransferase domain-containing protein [Selenomonadaceae bacterium]|nr:nucleotidyltransferase domain-containing protein [Selenomonadaceae bacterium]MBP3721916.1 nucleotidyltransferase domain-containing protein [Selenomonadaceae bacterium]
MDLKENVKLNIQELAKKHELKKVLLFGSRARGDNADRSDIDLAVIGDNSLFFAEDLENSLETLLPFDVVDLGEPIGKELRKNIEREGIVLYERVG